MSSLPFILKQTSPPPENFCEMAQLKCSDLPFSFSHRMKMVVTPVKLFERVRTQILLPEPPFVIVLTHSRRICLFPFLWNLHKLLTAFVLWHTDTKFVLQGYIISILALMFHFNFQSQHQHDEESAIHSGRVLNSLLHQHELCSYHSYHTSVLYLLAHALQRHDLCILGCCP